MCPVTASEYVLGAKHVCMTSDWTSLPHTHTLSECFGLPDESTHLTQPVVTFLSSKHLATTQKHIEHLLLITKIYSEGQYQLKKKEESKETNF